MSADDPKTVPANPCPICSKTRRVSEHLIEAALAASFLGNTSTYASEHGEATIRTETIGDWFKLAAQLEAVEVVNGCQEALFSGCEDAVPGIGGLWFVESSMPGRPEGGQAWARAQVGGKAVD